MAPSPLPCGQIHARPRISGSRLSLSILNEINGCEEEEKENGKKQNDQDQLEAQTRKRRRRSGGLISIQTTWRQPLVTSIIYHVAVVPSSRSWPQRPLPSTYATPLHTPYTQRSTQSTSTPKTNSKTDGRIYEGYVEGRYEMLIGREVYTRGTKGNKRHLYKGDDAS